MIEDDRKLAGRMRELTDEFKLVLGTASTSHMRDLRLRKIEPTEIVMSVILAAYANLLGLWDFLFREMDVASYSSERIFTLIQQVHKTNNDFIDDLVSLIKTHNKGF